MDVTHAQVLGYEALIYLHQYSGMPVVPLLAFNDVGVTFEMACDATISASTLPQPIGAAGLGHL